MNLNLTTITVGYAMMCLKMVLEGRTLTGKESNPDFKKEIQKAYNQLNKESKKYLAK